MGSYGWRLLSLPCIDNKSKLKVFGISGIWLMCSLIHLFKLRKNQVLNILLIICIFPDLVFLLLLCLIDWYLMASDTKVLFCPGCKWGLSAHIVGMQMPACKFWSVCPFSTKLGGVLFQTTCFTTVSRKLGGQVGKRHPIYGPLQEGQQD